MTTHMKTVEKLTHWKCLKCKKTKKLKKFGFKKNGIDFFKQCEKCRNLEKKRYQTTKPIKPSFLDDYPELKEEWDYEQNEKNELFPEKLTYGSNKKAFWICKEDNHHKWEICVKKRTIEKTGCPICSNRKICNVDACNSLYFTNPELREEWNGDIEDMKKINLNSHKKITWKCRIVNHHKWDSVVYSRTGKDKIGCPICSNRKICNVDACNSLYFTNPELREEWNGDIEDMKKTVRGSKDKIYWKCKKNDHHIWSSYIYSRTGKVKSGCPFCCNKKICQIDACNSLYYYKPELRDEWDGDVEDMKKVAPNCNKNVKWKCSKNILHKWTSTINSRVGKTNRGCPICNVSKLENEFNSLCDYYFQKNIILYKQYKFNDTKNINKLPYDGFLIYKKNLTTYNIRIEFQGIQHFKTKNNFYYKKSIIERIEIDCHKSLCAKKANHSLLVISYLCLGNIKHIIDQFMNDLDNQIYRFYIKPDVFIDLNNSTVIKLNNDELKIYQIYLYNIECLKQNSQIKFRFESTCKICEDTFINDDILWVHYFTREHKKRLKEHKQNLQEKYTNLFGVCLDGTPMLLENE